MVAGKEVAIEQENLSQLWR